ncbi:MAG: sensor histidine kinase, partial [Terriglobia bacterium]
EGVCIEMPELPEAPFQGDEDLMRQMILNLLDNSIKFTPSGGSVRLGLEPKGRWYRITVADNGVGVPQTAQSRIFDRFYRVDRAKSRQGENGSSGGAGLGLSIARWIAEAHHGQLKLLHSDEKGSTFAAVLPIPQVISSRVDSRAPSRSRLNLL